MEKALQYAREHFDTFQEQLKEFLRIPSVSTDSIHKGDVQRAAEWLAADMRRIGIGSVEVMPTGGHPIVYAEHITDPGLPTVLVYGHYDVQPPDPLDLWETDPFEPVVRDGNLYARGASDDKGQLFMHVKAAEAYLATEGSLPINLKFLIEGEEESGSRHLEPFIEEHQDMLRADIVLISDTPLFAEDVPSITYGLRGMAYVQVELTGPDRDLHSGAYGGGIENPINALCRLIADLHDEEHRITIPRFYEQAHDLEDIERERLGSLPFDEAEWGRSVGVEATKSESGYRVIEAISARPTLDVNGIWGGYQGEGAKTVLPSKAGAKISMRLVPDQKPDEIAEKIRAYFEANIPPTMKLDFRNLHGGDGIVVDTEQPAMKAAFAAMKAVFGKEPVFTREGGSIPVVSVFKRLLNMDTVLLGFGLNSDNLHSPNERFGLDRFRKGIETSVHFMTQYARRE